MKTIEIISSKSIAHRALICNYLSGGEYKVIYNEKSQDIDATEKCLKALTLNKKELYCGESGSTFRFLLPLLAALGREGEFYTEGRLPSRPLSPLYEELLSHGCTLSPQGEVPFKIKGQLEGGEYNLKGNVSSQYVSGLLMALPLLKKSSTLNIKGPLESEGYVNLTIKVLENYGIEIKREKFGFYIEGNQRFIAPGDYFVEGDWSNAAFWLVAGAMLEEGIYCKGLNLNSLQGDRKIIEILKDFGVEIKLMTDGVVIKRKSLEATTIDASQIPDLIPAVALLASRAKGTTVIKNAARLRLKESDRLKSISNVLGILGVEVEELKDGLEIAGSKKPLKGGEVNSHGDHRIAMMAAIASIESAEKVKILNSKAVEKSYPSFFEKLKELDLDKNVERG
ncbi:3-phosphoshikimate 1-carboxyvinyltransferase [Anaerosphaera multitolerans]|uniref:3-phosphoshikimate 1-carboxyvinyltransferase n=1 Tax=Anaerosphaera multitolerans TaxID=2487351 RepID=UPI0013E329AA|nr:3-phosphoshikimate 1-carboxyvinyltransferase [Anaerosphaera multitolerans]